MATKLNILVFVALLAATLHGSAAQTTHVVGDALGWTVPSGAADYRTWASRQTFTVGDVLVFNFVTGNHDVTEVSSAAFDPCNKASPISTSPNGPTNITLRTAGAHFYICSVGGHCTLGQKLAINVSAAAPTPPPAATPRRNPSPAPVSEPTPSPMAPRRSPSPAPISAPTPSPVALTPATSPSGAPQTYIVGDALGWSVPTSPTAYQTWARNKNFSVGDILVFNFASGAHNVAEMTSKAAYDSCDTSVVSTTVTTGPARITLTKSGEHFFTCTVPGHCSLGQKLAINVTGTDTTPPSSGRPASSPPSTVTPPGVSAPPPPNSASFAGAAVPVTLLSIALALFY